MEASPRPVQSRSTDWHQWVGLPHGIGRDPRHGLAADCLLMAVAVNQSLQRRYPAIDRNWFRMARDGKVVELISEFFSHTRPLIAPCDGAVAAMFSASSVAVVTYIDNGVLLVDESRGVRWACDDFIFDTGWREFS